MKDFLQKIKFLLLFIPILFCNACSSASQSTPIEKTAFKLNTIVTIKIYDSTDTDVLDHAMALCDDYELLFSRTNPQSELYQLNHGLLTADENGYYSISSETYQVISLGLHYVKLSNNSFDLAIAPLTSLWDFTSEEHTLPNDSDIQSVLPYLGSEDILLQEPDKIAFAKDKMGIDLGAIAKGYIADRIKDYLLSQNVHSATISLGGNVLCIGDKLGSPFTIGIQKPFANRNETIATMDITDQSVVSSGIYERFFEEDGIIYHHILNPRTGYPYHNGLIAVTIVADQSADADALSTTCFSMGPKQGMALINSLDYADAIFITDDYTIHYSDDFQNKYHVKQTE